MKNNIPELQFTKHPQINSVLLKFKEEDQHQPFRKVHRMVDLFEIIIKTHTSFIIGSYFKHKNIVSDEVKALLAGGLRAPPLGKWQKFSRTILEDMAYNLNLKERDYKSLYHKLKDEQQKNFVFKCNEKEGFYNLEKKLINLTKGERSALKSAFKKTNYQHSPKLVVNNYYKDFFEWDEKMEGDRDVISLRNQYAHGATKEDKACIKDIETYMPALKEFLNHDLFNKTCIALIKKEDGEAVPLVGDESCKPFFTDEIIKKLQSHYNEIIEGRPYLISESGSIIDMFPIMYNKSNDGKTVDITFFNDLKKFKDKNLVSYLYYPLGEHIPKSDIKEDFLSKINVDEWKEIINDEFREEIESLTEVFKGRENEKREIKEILFNRNQGFLMIYGEPGIGKSSLMAKIYQEITSGYSEEGEQDVKPEQKVHVIEYFISRKNQESARPDKFLDYINRRIEKVVSTEVDFGKNVDESFIKLQERIKKASQTLKDKGEKLIILIDGLDEGAGKDNNLLNYLITAELSNIFVAYTSRFTEEVNSFYLDSLPREDREEIRLKGLSKENIRAMLYEVESKYTVMENEKKSDIIGIIEEKCQGNPLYVNLLCKSIEDGKIGLDEIESRLPENIESFFKEFINRYGEIGNLIIDSIYILAAAKDYLSKYQLELILKKGEQQVGSADIENVFKVITEVLHIKEVDEYNSREDYYQLFHESFREYLEKNYPNNLFDAEEKIIRYCKSWDDYDGYTLPVRLYPLKFYSEHLIDKYKRNKDEKGNKEALYGLIDNNKYVDKQIELTKQYNYSFNMYENAMVVAKEEENLDKIINIAVECFKLHNRIQSSYEYILELSRTGDRNDLETALEMNKMFQGEKQFIIYMFILDEILENEKLDDPQKKELAEIIIEDLDNNVARDITILNWYEFYPLYLMVKALEELSRLKIHITPISKRAKINKVVEEDIIIKEIRFEKLLGGLEIDANIYQEMLPILAGHGKLKKIEQILEEQDTKTLKDIAVSAAKSKYFKSALNVTGMMRDGTDKLTALKCIAIEKAKSGAFDETEIILKEISNKLYKPDLYAVWAGALSKKEENSKENKQMSKNLLEKAIELARDSVDESSQIFFSPFIGIAEALAETGNFEKALEIANTNITDDCQRSSVLGKIARSLIEEKMPDKAFEIFKQMNGLPEVDLLVNLANTFAKMNELNKALEVVEEAKDFKEFRGLALIGVVEGLAECGNLSGALEVALETYQKDALVSIARELAKNGDLKRSKRELAKVIYIDSEKPSISESYVAIIALNVSVKLAKAGEFDRALEMVNCAGNSSRVLKLIVNELVKSSNIKNISKALEVAEEIAEDWDKECALESIANAYVKLGDLDNAEKVAIKATDSKCKSIIIATIAGSLIELDDLVCGREKIKEALLEAKKITNKKDKCRALEKIVGELVKSSSLNDLDWANNVAKDISDEIDKENALKKVTKAYAKSDYLDKAFELINEIDLLFEDTVIEALVESGKVDDLNKAIEVADRKLCESSIYYSYSDALKDIAKGYAKLGDINRSLEVIANIKHNGYKKDQIRNQMDALVKIIKVLFEVNDLENLDRVIKIFEKNLKKYNSKDVLYNSEYVLSDLTKIKVEMVEMYAKKGHPDEIYKALKIIKNMDDEEKKIMNYIKILPYLYKNHSNYKDTLKNIVDKINKEKGSKFYKELGSIISRTQDIDVLYILVDIVEDKVDFQARMVIFSEIIFNTYNLYTKIPLVIKKILPYTINSKAIIGDCLLLNVLYYRYISDYSPSEVNEELKKFEDIIDVSNMYVEEGTKYTCQNINDWIGLIEDEDDKKDIKDWARRVEIGEMTVEKFNDKVAAELRKLSERI